MKTRYIISILILVFFVFAANSFATDPIGIQFHKKFYNNSGQNAYDLSIFFNASVAAGTNCDPFTTLEYLDSASVKYKNPTAPLAPGDSTECITFMSTNDNLQINSAYWTDQNGNKITGGDLDPGDIQDCTPSGKKIPSVTFWGALVLTALVVASGIWLIRRRKIVAV